MTPSLDLVPAEAWRSQVRAVGRGGPPYGFTRTVYTDGISGVPDRYHVVWTPRMNADAVPMYIVGNVGG